MRIRSKLLVLAVPLMFWVGAQADEQHGRHNGDEQLKLKKTIDVQGNGLAAFDISFVDPKIELYVLADRTNASVDLFDSEKGRFITRIGTLCTAASADHFCFQGAVHNPDGSANNDISGPDGVVIVDHKEIWAGDGDSRIKVIDIASKSFITTIATGDATKDKRVDEMAYDPRDHILAAANNAASPPFVTLFDTNAKTILGKLTFQDGDPNANVDAQNGIEQPQWSPETGLFYISVPQVTSDKTIGGVSVIDPQTMKVIRTLLVSNCSPAGLALGPRHEALLGCSAAFNDKTQSLIIDITSMDTKKADAAVVASVPIGGSDEVWFDKGTQHYFLAGRNNLSNGKPDPILGSIDARTHKLDPSVETSATAHSVAADKNSHLVFLPFGRTSTTEQGNPCPDTGCVGVYRAHRDPFMEARDDDDHGHDQD
jgi:DNA-binding beta-propeller fold protein YncE